MANIRLKELIEANVDPKLVARSKETGKLVYFKSPENKAAAIKAGSHEDPKSKKGDEPKGDAKPNDMFGGDYAKDRSGDLPVGDLQYRLQKNKQASKDNLPKKASQLTWKDSNTISDILNKEAGLDGYAQTDDNSGAIMYNASKGEMPTYTLYMGSNVDYGKPDEFRVSLEPTYGNDPSKLQGKVDKSFKSAEDAMTYMTAVGTKYKKELEMDDSKTSTVDVDGQTDDELYDALYDMGYDFGEFGSDDFDEEGFADAAMSLGYRYDDKNKVWYNRDEMEESSTKLTSMIKK